MFKTNKANYKLILLKIKKITNRNGLNNKCKNVLVVMKNLLNKNNPSKLLIKIIKILLT